MSPQNKNVNDEILTIEKLKQYKGFENMSDAEAANYIASMEVFCIIAYEIYNGEKLRSYE